VLFQSGTQIFLQFVSQERPGAMVVAWQLPPPTVPKPVPVPLDKQPPKFNRDQTYSGYTVTLEGKHKLTPQWMPKVIVDDGRNTLVRLGQTLEGQRMPVVAGVLQNGKEAIVSSRLYMREDRLQDGAWMYIQGLHPAFVLRDAGGATVKVVRQVPPSLVQEVGHVQ
jgi:Conjugal transfer protein